MKKIIIFLIVLNLIVLLGQLWPEGAPPFAGTVNVAFLVLSLIFFCYSLAQKKSGSA